MDKTIILKSPSDTFEVEILPEDYICIRKYEREDEKQFISWIGISQSQIEEFMSLLTIARNVEIRN